MKQFPSAATSRTSRAPGIGAQAWLQRKCACGAAADLNGGCTECERKKTLGLQAQHLALGTPHDPLEQEADRVAEQVLAQPAGRATPVRTALLPLAGAAVQRAGGGALAALPVQVGTALTGAAQPLDTATRQFFELRFAHDFSQIRVRTDPAATDAVQARAFTVGQRIVFGARQYQPGTDEGRRLLAHELTHVLQQGHSAALQRKVSVQKPKTSIDNPTGKGLVQTNADTVEGYLRTLCSDGKVAVNKATGAVALGTGFCPPLMPVGTLGPPSPSPADQAKEPTGCHCLCTMVGSASDYFIAVNDKDWPHTLGNTVTTPSPNSTKLWGAATVSGKPLQIDPWLVLGHELCGHALLADQGLPDNNATRGEGGHQETVLRENQLRQEHGIEDRGSFKDPFCGESFFQDKAGPGPVQWSSSVQKCEAWRKKTYGKKYKISDKIP